MKRYIGDDGIQVELDERRYIGDGVSVELDERGNVVLSAVYAAGPGKYTIYLPPKTWEQLQAWWHEVHREECREHPPPWLQAFLE